MSVPKHPVVDALKAFARRMRANPAVQVVDLDEGVPASPAALAQARGVESMPRELLDCYAAMDGFRLRWQLAARLGKEHPGVGGSVELPTLDRNLGGWDDVAFSESDSDLGVRVVDAAACGRGLSPCYAEGDSGFWDSNDNTFDGQGYTLDSYFDAGINSLFVEGWVEHVAVEGFGSVCEAALEARKLLGIAEDEDRALPAPAVVAPAPSGRQPRRLVLDDDPVRLAVFRRLLPGCVTVESYDEAVAALSGRRFSEIYLDHDLLGLQTGADVAAWMASELPASKRPRIVVVHSWNQAGALDMSTTLKQARFTVDTRRFEFPTDLDSRPRGFLTGLVIPRKTRQRRRQ